MAKVETELGKYTLLDVLGEGSSARVFRAIHSGPMGFRKQVAVKQILPHVAQNPNAIRGLINEARLGGHLHHRNLVEIYEFDQAGASFYLAMEFVPGHTLARVAGRARDRGPIPEGIVAEIGIQLCDGLAYAHAARDEEGQPLHLIHRDLKPGNVMITPYGAVKIMDFGVAKSDANLYHTQVANITRGTPAYMSPEQVRGEHLDGRSDIFALGSVLAELVTGEVLFLDDNLHAVLHLVHRADVGHALELAQGRIPELVPVLERALQRDRTARYATADEMGHDLRRACEGLAPAGDLGHWLVHWMTDAPAEPDEDEAPTLLEARPPPISLEEGLLQPVTVEETEPPPPVPTSGNYSEETLLNAGVTTTIRVPGGRADDPLMDVFLARVRSTKCWIGSRHDEPDSRPDEFAHQVWLSRSLLIAATPVTQAQWTAVMGHNPSWAQGEDLPVETVSWFEAVEFCNRLSRSLELPEAYRVQGDVVHWDRDSLGFRLPTETEWEVAARAGQDHPFAGADDADDVAWYWDNTGGLTQPVGRKKPNDLGLYDMSGNVAEWVWDWYGPYPTDPLSTDPAGPDAGEVRVHRGGSSFNLAEDARVAARSAQVRPDERFHFLGFRLARTVQDGTHSSSRR
jgi:serine/threonine protein kinase